MPSKQKTVVEKLENELRKVDVPFSEYQRLPVSHRECLILVNSLNFVAWSVEGMLKIRDRVIASDDPVSKDFVRTQRELLGRLDSVEQWLKQTYPDEKACESRLRLSIKAIKRTKKLIGKSPKGGGQ